MIKQDKSKRQIHDENGWTISEFGLTICRFYVFFFTWMHSEKNGHWFQIHILNKKIYESCVGD